MINDLVVYLFRHFNRYRKPQANRSPGLAEDRGVDTYRFAPQIDQWPTRISRVDRGIRLDEVFIVIDANAISAHSTDDPRRQGLC